MITEEKRKARAARQGEIVTSEEGDPVGEILPPNLLELKDLGVKQVSFTIVGVTPLICNSFSKKAQEEMLKQHQKKTTKGGKPPKDVQELFEHSLYHIEGGGFAFRTTALKSSAVSASPYEGIKWGLVKGGFHIFGEFVRINGKPKKRQDWVRNANGAPDIRIRSQFWPWSIDVLATYVDVMISPAQIMKLYNRAGFAVGLGDWRPEKSGGGQHGLFHVKMAKDQVLPAWVTEAQAPGIVVIAPPKKLKSA